jgi:hypothetical protein
MNNSNYFDNEMINNIRLNLNGYLDNSDSKKIQHFSNYIKTGGSCPCAKVLDAFCKSNIDLALYIIDEGKCCNMCIDTEGNTILHHLVNFSFNEDCYSALLDSINSTKASDYINMQNYKGQTPMLLAVLNDNQELAINFENAGARKDLRDTDGNYVGSNDDESEINKNYVKNVVNIYLPNKAIESINSDDFIKNVQQEVSGMFNNNQDDIADDTELSDNNDSTLNSEQFIKLLADRNKLIESMKTNELSANNSQDNIISDNSNIGGIEDSDEFFKAIKEKYGNDNRRNGNIRDNSTVQMQSLQDTDDESSVIRLPDNEIAKLLNEDTSDTNNNNNKNKLFTHKTNPVKLELFGNNASDSQMLSSSDLIDLSSGSINSELLQKEISKLKLSSKFNNLKGGGSSNNNYGKTYFRTLNSDTDNSVSYNEAQYLSDFEYGSVGGAENEISRMLSNKKSQLHQEVIDSIVDLLNDGIIKHKSNKIEANETNAKLVKAFIYKKTSKENPQMTGMDKILLIKGMSDDDIVNITKSMPSLESIQNEITKHMEEKNKDRGNSDSESDQNSIASDMSDTSSNSSNSKKGKKSTTKKTKTVSKTTKSKVAAKSPKSTPKSTKKTAAKKTTKKK